jgi:hypothetical protein
MSARYEHGSNKAFRYVACPALQGPEKVCLLGVVDYSKSISIYKERTHENPVDIANHRDVCRDRGCG